MSITVLVLVIVIVIGKRLSKGCDNKMIPITSTASLSTSTNNTYFHPLTCLGMPGWATIFTLRR